MPDFNDVVRHVILRIIVDQAGLAEELGSARAKLKGLKDAEGQINRDRAKSHESVTKAVEQQSKILAENEQAHHAAQRAAAGGGREATEATKARTDAVKADTKAVNERTLVEARAAQIDAKTRQAELDSIAERSSRKKKAAEEAAGLAAKTSAVETKARQAELDAIAERSRRKRKAQALDLLDLEALAAAQARTRDAQDRTANNASIRERTTSGIVSSTNARSRAATEIAGARTDVAQSQAEVAAARAQAAGSQAQLVAARALNEQDKTNLDIGTRRERMETAIARAKADINKVIAGTNLTEQRSLDLAERRARLAEKEAQRRRGVGAAAGALTADLATGASRAVFSAPRSFVRNRFTDVVDVDGGNSEQQLGKISEAAKRAGGVLGGFFRSLRKGSEESGAAVATLGSRVRAFFGDLNRPRVGGSGGGLGGDIIRNFTRLSDAFGRAFEGMGRHLFSFQSLIVVVIAALGPLAAILGAVGAAALGLASNLGALVGVVGALPGLLGAAVAGFGALALVIKPLSSVFTAYSQAQAAAAKGTVDGAKAAVTAAHALQDAQRRLADATLAHQRAVEDAPRAQLRLNDARKQATRQIEDYRTALRKLKFDEEGASLDVESAQQAYRRALVDPTASSLDRRQAAHSVEGSLFDQQAQATQAARLQQDAAEAFKKGVDGMDQVVDALRAIVDANRAVTDTTTDQTRAQEDLVQAQKDVAAGGSAARAAMDKYRAELAKLSPKTRAVAEAIIGLSDSFKAMRNRLSERIFGPLSEDTGKFKDILAELESFLGPAASAIGVFAKRALDLFTNPEWKRFFSEQGEESGYIIQQLGDALLFTADAFKNITEVARPFTRFIVDGIKGMAAAFDSFTSSERGRQKIADFLALTEKRMRELWPVIKNLASGIGGFFKALNDAGDGSKDFTTWFNEGLLKASQTFKELGEKAQDPNGGFQKWLRDVRPLLHDIVEFLKAAGVFFGDLFSDQDNLNEASRLLQQISQRWLPALADIFDKLSQSGVISKIATGLSSAFEAVNNLLDAGGLDALSTFASALQHVGDVMNFLTTVVTWLTDHVPGLGVLLAAVGSTIAFVFGAALIAKFSGLTFVVRTLLGLFKGIRDVAKSTKWGNIPTNPGGGGAGGSGSGSSTGNKPTPTTPGGGGTAATGTTTGSIMQTLRRCEAYLRQIAVNTGGVGSADTIVDGDDKDGKGGKKGGRKGGKGGRLTNLADEAVDVAEDAGKAATKGSGFKNLLKGLIPASVAGLPWLSGLFGDKTPSATGAAPGAAASGGKSVFGKLGSAAKGLGGGLIANLVATLGGQYLTDKYVKDADDRSSVNTAISRASTYSGIGSLAGMVVPGLGNAVGGTLGAAAGIGQSYATDKNFRDFAVDKLPLPKPVKSLVSGEFSDKLGAVATSVFGGGKPGGGVLDAVKGGLGGVAGSVSGALGGSSDIGKTILDSLKRAAGGIGNFFTKAIPDFFHRGVSAITTFFTKTLPSLPGRAFDAFLRSFGRALHFFQKDLPQAVGVAALWTVRQLGKIGHFFTVDAPRAVGKFFTRTIPEKAGQAWGGIKHNLWDPFVSFIRGIPDFFTETIPRWFGDAKHWLTEQVYEPVKDFVTKTIPDFFTETIPKWFEAAPGWFDTHVKTPIHDFFTVTLPAFFTEDLPNAIAKVPGFVYDTIVKPVVDFFKGMAGHFSIEDLLGGGAILLDWAKGLFARAGKDIKEGYADADKKMSGGIVKGVYQGIEDTAHVMATPGEMVIRRSKVEQPGAKAFLTDWNEGRVDIADFFKGLSAQSAPVMSLVPADAWALTGAVPAVVNHTVNHAPLMGDVTIHNPIREKSDHSLRRQVQLAANRHRR